MPLFAQIDLTPSIMASPFQYGFAGFCVLLTAILVWGAKSMFALVRDNQRCIDGNTNVIKSLGEQLAAGNKSISDQVASGNKMLSDVRDRLLQRPCLRDTPPPKRGLG